jgi:hypothetical protein
VSPQLHRPISTVLCYMTSDYNLQACNINFNKMLLEKNIISNLHTHTQSMQLCVGIMQH